MRLALVWLALAATPTVGLAAPSGKAMDRKELLVRGWDRKDLEAILKDFRRSYEGRPGSAFGAVIEVRSDGSLKVTFPTGIDPELFMFLVNYVQYPKDFDLRGRRLTIVGRATLSPAFSLPDPALAGQKASIYVPADDRDYDQVYVRTDAGRTFVNSFSASAWKPIKMLACPWGSRV